MSYCRPGDPGDPPPSLADAIIIVPPTTVAALNSSMLPGSSSRSVLAPSHSALSAFASSSDSCSSFDTGGGRTSGTGEQQQCFNKVRFCVHHDLRPCDLTLCGQSKRREHLYMVKGSFSGVGPVENVVLDPGGWNGPISAEGNHISNNTKTKTTAKPSSHFAPGPHDRKNERPRLSSPAHLTLK